MSDPKHARPKAKSGREYLIPDFDGNEVVVPSVTTILGALAKQALINWASKETATYAVENRDKWLPIAEQDPSGAIDLLKGSPWRKRDRAADMGSLVHKIAECAILGLPIPEIPDELVGKTKALIKFLEDWGPKFEMTEATVCNLTYGWAGTLDAIVRLQTNMDSPLVLDYKSGSGVYPETALQLAAYRHAEYVLTPAWTLEPMPKTDGGVVVHLRDDGYDLLPISCGEDIYGLFTMVRELHHFQEVTSKKVIGRAVQPSVAPFEPELVR